MAVHHEPLVLIFMNGKLLLRSKHFFSKVTFFRTGTKPVSFKAAQTLRVIERSHEVLLRAYQNMQKEIVEVVANSVLSSVVMTVNERECLGGLVPTLLSHCSLQRFRFCADSPKACIIDKDHGVAKSKRLLSRYFSKRQLQIALLCHSNSDVTEIRNILLSAHIILYRIHCVKWTGFYSNLGHNKDTCTILDMICPKESWATVIRPYHHPSTKLDSHANKCSTNQD